MKFTKDEIKNKFKSIIETENVFGKKWPGIENLDFNNIEEFNKELKNSNNFDIKNYQEYSELLNFFNIDFENSEKLNKDFTFNTQINKSQELKNKWKSDVNTGTSKYLNDNPNLLLMSNPNSGKTKYIKDTLTKDYPTFQLSFQNNENSSEFKKELFYINHQGELIVGNFLKGIVSAAFNHKIPHFIIIDEIGTFKLDNIFAATLKSILKKSQRIDLNPEKITNDKINDIKNKNEITFDNFIKFSQLLKEQNNFHSSQFSTYTDGNISLELFLPSNLYIIGISNYEEEILESLIETKGWSGNERFNIIHFYNFLNQENIGNIKNKFYNPFTIEPENNDENTKKLDEINEFNSKLFDLINKELNIKENYDNLVLSAETIRNIKQNQFTLYIPNFFTGEAKNDDDFKEIFKEYVEKMLENMYIEYDEVKTFISKI